jgi:hypothetical protein
MKKTVKLTESDLSKLVNRIIEEDNEEKFQSTIESYSDFLDEIRTTKKLMLIKTMNGIYDELVMKLGSKGWSPKGKNLVSDSMVDNSTWRFKFTKMYGNNEVIIELNGNLRDDYVSGGGYNTIKVNQEIPEFRKVQPFNFKEGGVIGLAYLLGVIDNYFS